MRDDLGKRMKEQYEVRTRTFLPRRTYTIIRLDGKAFHTYTRGLERPFDAGLAEDMTATMIHLCDNIQGCKFGYVQSDEISLLLTDFEKDTTSAWFDGEVQKIVSVSASMATNVFNRLRLLRKFYEYMKEDSLIKFKGELLGKGAEFDSRVYTIPDPTEVENYFVWRQKDAIRNSITMLAQSLYSHSELNGKSQSDQQEMIFKKGKNWNDVSDRFKRGTSYRMEKRPVMSADSFDQTVYYDSNWVLDPFDFLKDRKKLSNAVPKYA